MRSGAVAIIFMLCACIVYAARTGIGADVGKVQEGVGMHSSACSDPSDCMKLLIVKTGFGGGTKGAKWNYLEAEETFDLNMPFIPEFADDSEGGLAILRDAIKTVNPDVLVASSRGSKYVEALVTEGSWSGRTFLVSPTNTGKLCAAQEGTIPLCIAHGTKDTSNKIDTVRADVYSSKVAFMEEFEEGHSLRQLTALGRFGPLLRELYDRFKDGKETNEWKALRPEWIQTYLKPKMTMEVKDIKQHKEQRNNQLSMLDAIKNRKKNKDKNKGQQKV